MQHKNFIENIRTNSGFTLIEIAIVIMASGFIMVMAAQFIKLYTINLKHEKTLDHLRASQNALNFYVALEGRYPCPADPTLTANNANYGLERCRSVNNLNNNQDNCTGSPLNLSCTNLFSRDGDQNGQLDVIMIGIIPFRTLADRISLIDRNKPDYFEKHRLDGYSTYISYSVTEQMSDRTRHNTLDPVNPNTGGMRIVDENQITLTIPDNSAHYAVYSHGDNRKGGYSSAGQLIDNCFVSIAANPPALPAPGPSGAAIAVEIENCENNDAIFVKGIRSIADNSSYNDDILFFKSTGNISLWKRSLDQNETAIYNTNLGNIGVGTEDPTEKLHIAGDISSDGSFIANEYCNAVGGDCLKSSAIAGEGTAETSSGANETQCDPGEVAYAIHESKIVCREVEWDALLPSQNCPLDEYLTGFSNRGNIECKPLP